MTFVFLTFIVSSRSTQNCWSAFNYCCSPTSNFDIRVKSSAKSNSHTCTFVKANASHFLPSKRSSKASKYSPNNRGLRRQPCFTPCWQLKLEVTPSFRWLMCTVSLAYIACRRCNKHPSTSRPTNTCHSTSHGTVLNAFFEVHKIAIEWLLFCLALFYQSL